ncbi:helix-turn-helix domain containing protein [Glycomyces luteolus]|uniref:Helix-turn-helix domain containing protein n=1 Tax=Glycomyces luteolus TaxID=2670330 RepID=A0A9X3PAB7_9ACTN|nr:TetR/AcrR family transcriptional regulator [Glycomyces luteolus]MDA1359595.1 helix-turn-helix domain containing protein [Glycomyces luteolus]
MSTERPLRADAARNRSKILEAADRQIIAHGPEVRMEAIAEEAGVAVGTLYRHFPTKDALVAAVVEGHVEWIMTEVEATADRMEAGADALEEFRHFLLSTVELAASDKAAKAAARALGAQLDIERPIERGIAAMERIIKVGKQSGHLRADLSVEDFFLLFATVPVDQPPKARERWMELVLNGIAAASVTRASEAG